MWKFDGLKWRRVEVEYIRSQTHMKWRMKVASSLLRSISPFALLMDILGAVFMEHTQAHAVIVGGCSVL